MLLKPLANGFFRIVLRFVLRTSRMSFSQNLEQPIRVNVDQVNRTVSISVYLRKSGLEVYGEATSLIFSTIIAVMKMQMTLTMVNKPDIIPLIKNSVGM